MKHRISSWSLWVLLLAVCACVPADYSGRTAQGSGIGGTGSLVAGGSGIGGTGLLAAGGSGIGGTGSRVGREGEVLGIIGRITGFGSIWVNGLEVELDHLAAGLDRPLAEGNIVQVVAVRRADGLQAETVHSRYEVEGPVESIAGNGLEATILNQRVRIFSDTFLPENWPAVAPDTILRVSGFRGADNLVLASRIDIAPPGSPAALIGRVERVAERVSVSGTRVQWPAGNPAPAVGDIVRLRGTWQRDHLAARRAEIDRSLTFTHKVDRYLLQAVALPGSVPEHMHMGGLPVAFRMQAALPMGRPLVFDGVAGAGGMYRIQRVVPSPRLRNVAAGHSVTGHAMSPMRGSGMGSRLPRGGGMWGPAGGFMGGRGGRMGR